MKKRLALSVLLIAIFVISSITTFAANNEKERKIIVFNEGTDINQQEYVLKKHGGVKVKGLGCINAVVAYIPKNNKLKDQNEVIYFEDDLVVNLNVNKIKDKSKPTTTEVIPWGIEYMGAPSQWDATTDNVKVGVIDTGIDRNHPDLKANIKGSYNAITNKKSADDDNGHGTHVAGIIAAGLNDIGVVGMVPNADLYSIKVLDSAGNGYVSDIIEGIDWAIKNDIDIINMSFGTMNDIQSLREVITQASQANIIMVAAAGNNYGGASEYPAAYPEVISVGAIDKDGSIADFSAQLGVDVYAPGVNIYSTYLDKEYIEMNGTSMACPHMIRNSILNLLK